MLTKYRFISVKQYLDDVSHTTDIYHPKIFEHIKLHLDTLPENTIIFTNGNDTIDTFNHHETRIKIPFQPLLKSKINLDEQYIYKSINSFDQNNMHLSFQIRNDIITTIVNNHNKTSTNNILLGIGGEYYLYQCFINYFVSYDKIIGFTNNIHIQEDAIYNYGLHDLKGKSQSYNLDYYSQLINNNENVNLDILINSFNNKNLDIIINLAKLNVYVLEFINIIKDSINTLVIISCKEKDFKVKKELLPYNIKTNLISKSYTDEYIGQTITVHHYIK